MCGVFRLQQLKSQAEAGPGCRGSVWVLMKTLARMSLIRLKGSIGTGRSGGMWIGGEPQWQVLVVVYLISVAPLLPLAPVY